MPTFRDWFVICQARVPKVWFWLVEWRGLVGGGGLWRWFFWRLCRERGWGECFSIASLCTCEDRAGREGVVSNEEKRF